MPCFSDLLGIRTGEGVLLQRRHRRHQGGAALQHRDFSGPGFPEGGRDVVGGVVGAHHDAVLALVGIGPGMGAGVVLITGEALGSGDLRHVRVARHPQGHHQVARPQHDRLAIALGRNLPEAFVRIEAALRAGEPPHTFSPSRSRRLPSSRPADPSACRGASRRGRADRGSGSSEPDRAGRGSCSGGASGARPGQLLQH